MPNIEIHGFGNSPAALNLTKKSIRRLMRGSKEQGDYVITPCNDTAEDHDGDSQPYIRLVSSEPDTIDNLLERLTPLEMDIEVLVINRFIPKFKVSKGE